MEKQEARRRAAKPKIREQSPEAPPRAKRKGEEVYYDEVGWDEGLIWGTRIELTYSFVVWGPGGWMMTLNDGF